MWSGRNVTSLSAVLVRALLGTVEEIDLSRNELVAFPRDLAQAPLLRVLDLRGNAIPGGDVPFQAVRNVERLEMDGNPACEALDWSGETSLTEESMPSFRQIVVACPELAALNLSRSSITSAFQLGALVHALPGLRTLDVSLTEAATILTITAWRPGFRLVLGSPLRVVGVAASKSGFAFELGALHEEHVFLELLSANMGSMRTLELRDTKLHGEIPNSLIVMCTRGGCACFFEGNPDLVMPSLATVLSVAREDGILRMDWLPDETQLGAVWSVFLDEDRRASGLWSLTTSAKVARNVSMELLATNSVVSGVEMCVAQLGSSSIETRCSDLMSPSSVLGFMGLPERFYALLQGMWTGRSIELSDLALDDEGARILGEGLRSNTALQYLWLTANEIGDEGAQGLGEGLRSNTALQLLDLTGNPIGEEGRAFLSEWIESGRVTCC